MKLAEEAVMDIHAGVEVGMAHVGANGAEEEFASFAWDALACLLREPHALAATPRTILRRAMGIDFDTHHANGIGFFFRCMFFVRCGFFARVGVFVFLLI